MFRYCVYLHITNTQEIMKTYQAFAKTTENGQLVNTEIKAKNMSEARRWFKENTLGHEKVHLN